MKILKYLLFIILGLIAVFLLIGLFSSSVSYQSQIEVDATAEQAWSAMSDEENLSEWLNGYQRTELVSGTANTVGAVSNIYFIENGEEMVIQETITGISPNERMAMDFNMADFMDMEYEMLLDEEGGMTRITTNSVVQGNGIFAKAMTALMKGSMESQEEENLGKLKAVIESTR